MTKRVWDGKTYDRIGTPQAEWGKVVLDRMQLRGDETIVDAGCGSGRVTELLLERLPQGRVLAIDGSASMIEAARERLGSHANVEFTVMDLLALDLGGRQVDGVISTATFHWITDHARLFERLRAVLRPGGQLVAQCGGTGNIQRVLAEAYAVMAEPAWSDAFAGYTDPHRFADAPETEALLHAAGFAQARCWLQDAPVNPPEPPVFLGTVILGGAMERLSAERGAAFLAEVLGRLPEPFEADYVRLNIDAIA
jgi:trans-aconitate 2-methyltransferase